MTMNVIMYGNKDFAGVMKGDKRCQFWAIGMIHDVITSQAYL